MLAQVAGRLYTSIVSFLVTMVMLARILSDEDFGIFNYYLTLYYIFITIIDFGSNTIAIREASQDISRLPGLLKALVRIRGTASFLCLIVVCGVAMLFEKTWSFRLLICLASLHLLAYSLGGFNAVFHVRMRFDYAALVSGSGHTIFLVLSGTAYLMGSKNPALYLIAYGAGMTGNNIANYLLSRRFIPEERESDRPESISLFREALPLGISAVMVTIYFYVDTLLLRPMKGEAAVGYYNAAYRMLTFAVMVPVLFNQVIFPVFSQCFGDLKKDMPRLKRIFQRALLYMGATGAPAAAALLFFSDSVITFVCGEAYRRSSACLSILGLAMAAIFFTYPHISILVASGRQILFAWIAGISGLVNVGLNLIMIPLFSIEGAAWATVITEVLVLLSGIFCVRRFTSISGIHREKELYKIPLAVVIVGLAAYLLKNLPLLWGLAILALIYVIVLYALRILPFEMQDEDRD